MIACSACVLNAGLQHLGTIKMQGKSHLVQLP
jgi:hypothetical protein